MPKIGMATDAATSARCSRILVWCVDIECAVSDSFTSPSAVMSVQMKLAVALAASRSGCFGSSAFAPAQSITRLP